MDNILDRAFYRIMGKAGLRSEGMHHRLGHVVLGNAWTAGDVLAETVWPSRCVLCGNLGTVLCDTCAMNLPYIDQWLACPLCGAPYGIRQCCECNTFSLSSIGRRNLPFEQGVSAVMLDDQVAQIVRARKDQGERRLVGCMAYKIACAIPPAWLQDNTCVTFPPSTSSARRKRGFCHAQELASEVALLLQVPCRRLLDVRAMKDQRMLGRRQRAQNVGGRFLCQGNISESRTIFVDDVYTTGSTSMAASDALAQAGAQHIYIATFARA